jgi:hypothetical protein
VRAAGILPVVPLNVAQIGNLPYRRLPIGISRPKRRSCLTRGHEDTKICSHEGGAASVAHLLKLAMTGAIKHAPAQVWILESPSLLSPAQRAKTKQAAENLRDLF